MDDERLTLREKVHAGGVKFRADETSCDADEVIRALHSLGLTIATAAQVLQEEIR